MCRLVLLEPVEENSTILRLIMPNMHKNHKEILLSPVGDCLFCTSLAKDKKGYIRIQYNYVHTRLHRLIYRMLFGEIPKGMVVMHDCDHPSCVNPMCLHLGTPKENSHDAKKKGRTCRGERSPKAKLKEFQVIDILLSNDTNKILAQRYGVSKNTIKAIRNNKTWTYLERPEPMQAREEKSWKLKPIIHESKLGGRKKKKKVVSK